MVSQRTVANGLALQFFFCFFLAAWQISQVSSKHLVSEAIPSQYHLSRIRPRHVQSRHGYAYAHPISAASAWPGGRQHVSLTTRAVLSRTVGPRLGLSGAGLFISTIGETPNFPSSNLLPRDFPCFVSCRISNPPHEGRCIALQTAILPRT